MNLAREAIDNERAAAATIQRLLDEIGGIPAHVDFEDASGGDIVARIAFDDDSSEIICQLSREGDLIAARLIEP
ncbi:hypothetical protein FHS31_002871 [Sphingomonas vulcanisoli]|uniref:Uncharacterized protein n=1 Tax=Sphingomonas vulcanisoli TaxID=1658060 RepID=A0ABX0TX03_9SPHN|nr:hypothetical protein [Sphingomonas vulcanisoli]NIJ09239.1 hypothetical protein [Sphingomonas vulcanisoli]